MATDGSTLKEQERELIETEEGRFRALPGPLGTLQRLLLCSITLLGIAFITSVHMFFGLMVYTAQYIGVALILMLVCTFLSTPMRKHSPRGYLPWYDLVLALVSVPPGLYLALHYPYLSMRLGEFTTDTAFFGGLLIVLVLEALRRFAGWPLVIVVTVIILCGRFADMLPGPMHGIPTPWERLLSYLFLDPNSMLNLAIIAIGIALAFIMFGQVLVSFGGGKMLADLALVAFGRSRGGSAKAAVVGSSLLGTITGGPVVNVMISGSVTIPMMVRSGCSRAMAGAVEAVASSGGQIMPPVMGAVAFLIAQNLGVPYADVAIAAALPAILFYVVLFVQVDLEAGKMGIRPLPSSQLPSAGTVLRDAWVVFPCVFVLVYTLFIIRMEPSSAGLLSGLVSIPFLMMSRPGRGRFLHRLISTIEGTGKMVMNIGIIMCGAGFIVGVAGVSGISFNLAYTLTTIGEQNLLLLLVLAAMASVILGMGMPSVPAYALVATLIAPALIQLEVPALAAHIFIFYFAVVSNWTPPVALAAFAASTIARESPNKIGFIAVRLGILAYIIPFLFVYSPALILMSSSWVVIALSAVTAVGGAFFLGVALVGYLYRPVSPAIRVIAFIAAVCLLIPFRQETGPGLWINFTGFVLASVIIWLEVRKRVQPSGADRVGDSAVASE